MADRDEFVGRDRDRDGDRDGVDRERDRDRRDDGEDEEPRKRRSRFSDAPASGFSDAPPTGFASALSPAAPTAVGGSVPADARERAMALAASLSQKFATGSAAPPAAPTGFSSASLGLTSLFGAPSLGGLAGGPPPGEPPPPPGKLMGTAKRWNMEKGFG